MNNYLLRVLLLGLFFFNNRTESHMQNRTWDPQGFDETSKWAKSAAYDAIKLIQWRGNEVVLDIGTGDGKIAAGLAQIVPKGHVLAIDPSLEMIKFARQHYSKSLFRNLDFEVNDALGFNSDIKFDVITSFTAFHLVADQQRALKNFKSMLKEGGCILLKFPIGDGFEKALDKVMQFQKWNKYFHKFHSGWYFHTKAEYEQFVLQADLKPISIEEGILDECYDNEEELAKAISYWLPHMQQIPENQQRAFLNDLVKLFLQEVPADACGKVHHYEPFCLIHASK